jgi:hypothetical protein
VFGRKKRTALERALDGSELPKKLLWMAVATGVTTLGGRAVRMGLDRAWKVTRKRKPPKDAASRDVPWREAILWTVASGVVVGLGQLLVRRGMEEGWVRFTGEEPPA